MLLHRTITTQAEEFQNLTIALMEMERLGLADSNMFKAMREMWEQQCQREWKGRQ